MAYNDIKSSNSYQEGETTTYDTMSTEALEVAIEDAVREVDAKDYGIAIPDRAAHEAFKSAMERSRLEEVANYFGIANAANLSDTELEKRVARAELEADARHHGVPNASGMSDAELEALVDEAERKEEATTETSSDVSQDVIDLAELREFAKRHGITFTDATTAEELSAAIERPALIARLLGLRAYLAS